MQTHYSFLPELEKLNKKLIRISTMTEERVRRATQIILTRNPEDIQELIRSDYEVDKLEVDIEEDCLKLLALYNPVAGDLRFIVTVIKINNEIERIADIAVSIGLRVQSLMKYRPVEIDFDFKTMSEKAISMLKMSLDALVQRNTTLARRVFRIDDEVDAMKRLAYDTITRTLPTHPDMIHSLINTYLLAGHLERIADRATNIAEEVVYLVEGSIIRNG